MVYSKLMDLPKSAAHCLLDLTFPSSPLIAATAALVGWYGHNVSMTYCQGYITDWFIEKMRVELINSTLGLLIDPKNIGIAIAPLFVPYLAPQASFYISLGASCATSLTLNLASKTISYISSAGFETRPNNAETQVEKDLPAELEEAPIARQTIPPHEELIPNMEQSIAKVEEFFKEIKSASIVTSDTQKIDPPLLKVEEPIQQPIHEPRIEFVTEPSGPSVIKVQPLGVHVLKKKKPDVHLKINFGYLCCKPVIKFPKNI